MTPALRDAAKDTALTVTSYRVLLFLNDHLDVSEGRPVKQGWLASQLNVTDRAVRESLGQLTTRGYLNRVSGKPGPGGSPCYTLQYSRKTDPVSQTGVMQP